MLPLPRTRKRLAAPRLDFIFGITTSFSLTPGGSLREHLKPRLSLVARQLRRLLRLLRLRRAWPMEPSWAPPSAWLLLLLLVASPSSPAAVSALAPGPSPSAGLPASGTAPPGRPHPDLSSLARANARRTPCAPSRGRGT